MKTTLRKLIEGLEVVERMNPTAKPWARDKNVVIGPVEAPEGSETEEKLKRLGWERGEDDVSGENSWELYVTG